MESITKSSGSQINNMQNKYKVEIIVKHIEHVFAENEEEAKEKAMLKVFEEKINHANIKGNLEKEDFVTGYKVIPLRADAVGEFI